MSDEQPMGQITPSSLEALADQWTKWRGLLMRGYSDASVTVDTIDHENARMADLVPMATSEGIALRRALKELVAAADEEATYLRGRVSCRYTCAWEQARALLGGAR